MFNFLNKKKNVNKNKICDDFLIDLRKRLIEISKENYKKTIYLKLFGKFENESKTIETRYRISQKLELKSN